MRTLISIDIESTGLDPQRDEVVELAAVKSQNGKIISTFQELVRPIRPIPRAIQALTNITDDMVKNARTLAQVQPDFEAFLEGGILIGHNVAFDIGFLSAKGFTLKQHAAYDTWKLATLLLPHASSHSLEILTKELGIGHIEKHRAEHDARATLELFDLLEEEIRKLPSERIRMIAELAERSTWAVADVFADVLESLPKPAKKTKKQTKKSTDHPIDPALPAIEHRFADEQHAIKQGTASKPATKEQKQLATELKKALEAGGTTLLEANGIERLTSLLSVCVEQAAQKTGQVLVVLTDARRLERAVHHLLPKIQAEDAKGSFPILEAAHRYVCLRAVEQMRHRPHLTEEELHTLARVLLWIPVLQDGRFTEVGLSGRSGSPEQGLSAAVAGCGSAHAEVSKDLTACPWPQALAVAEKAPLVLLSHETLAALPEAVKDAAFIIIDEPEALPGILSDRLTQRWTATRARLAIQTAMQEQSESDQLQQTERIDLFFGLVGTEAAREHGPEEQYASWSVRITKGFRLSGTYWKLEKAAANLQEHLLLLTEADPKGEVAKFIQFLQEVFLEPLQEQEHVAWVEVRERGQVLLAQAPLWIAPLLKEKVWTSKRKAIVLVGDVLFERLDGTATYLREELGLSGGTKQIILEVPEHTASVFVRTDLPEPGQPGYVRAVGHQIAQAAEGGKAVVVLTTSQTTVRALHRDLALPLKEKGVLVIGQGATGGLGKVQHLFRTSEKPTVLLGGMDFWTRVELPPKEIGTLLVTRLPFGAPTRTLAAARNESHPHGEAFERESLPEALLLFRRGIGRILQSQGHATEMRIILLDSRLKTRDYGRDFLDTLKMYPTGEGDEKAMKEFFRV